MPRGLFVTGEEIALSLCDWRPWHLYFKERSYLEYALAMFGTALLLFFFFHGELSTGVPTRRTECVV